jgi:hypothetical protein
VAEEVLVKEQLTPNMISAGDELSKRLRNDNDFGLLCSLWLYTSDFSRWNMVVGTPLVESSGPIHAYRLIEGIIGDNWPYSETPLNTISILRSNHSLVRALRSLGHFEIQDLPPGPRPSPTVRVGKKITLSRVQDVFIEDALIYYIR